ncbi:hypothetical protein EX30DRAFT_340175 [Ascodesmis nigricans]|uniref:Uncharacterized protein n=1 Tax=Ascodesmis nigricans TaxID=341454 RepID=A0A4S2MZY1_9PEZI|nr:hypothetical protein EX30DRAFT_340175 [Ascodesmis nigricans]
MAPSGINRPQLELPLAPEYPGVGSNRRRASSLSMPAGTSRAEVVEFLPRITELTASLTNNENTISRTRFSLDDDDEEDEAPLLSRESAIYNDTDSDSSEENEFTSLRLVRSPSTINLRRLLRVHSPPVPEPSDVDIEPIHLLIPSNRLPRRHTSDSVPEDSPLRMPLRRVLGEQLLQRRFASLGRHRTQESFLYGEVQRRRQQDVVVIPTSSPTGWEVRLVDGVGELGPEDAIGSLLSRYRDVDPAEIEEDIGPLMMDGQGDDGTPCSGSEEESEEDYDDDYDGEDPQDGAPAYNDPFWDVDHPVYHDDDDDERKD